MNKPHPARPDEPALPANANEPAFPTQEPKKKRTAKPTDPVLLAVARLSRILDEVPVEKQRWVMEYLNLCYGKKPETP